jgi:hypothetical protein
MLRRQLGDGWQSISGAQVAGQDLLAQFGGITSYGPRGARGGATGTGMIPAIVVATRRSAWSTQAAYTLSVVAPPLPWPRRPATVRTSTPAAMSSVAEYSDAASAGGCYAARA